MYGTLIISFLRKHTTKSLVLMMLHPSLNGCGSHVLWANTNSFSDCSYIIGSTPENFSKERIWNFKITHVFFAMAALKKISFIFSLNAHLANGAGDLSTSDGIHLFPHRIC
jgi:hypothetical protein